MKEILADEVDPKDKRNILWTPQTLKFAPQTIINETDQKLCSFMSESLYTRLPVSS